MNARRALPDDVRPYRRTASFTEANLPRTLAEAHATKAGVWAEIVVERGRLELVLMESGESLPLEPGSPGVLAPEERHRVAPDGPVRFHVQFHR